MEAIRQILPRQRGGDSSGLLGEDVLDSTFAAAPPPWLPHGHSSSLHLSTQGAARLCPCQACRANDIHEMDAPVIQDPAFQEMVTAPLLPSEEGQAENLLFSLSSVTQNLKKRAVSSISGSQDGADGSV